MNRLGILNNQIRILKSEQNGHNWVIPVIDGAGIGMAMGDTTEEWVFRLLQKIHHRNKIDVFIDVGVNLGQTLMKIKSIHPAVQYIGFEPNPDCVYYVDYLIRLNQLSNTQLNCLALGDRQDYLNLNFKGLQDTRATLLNDKKLLQTLDLNRKVPVIPLDDLHYEFDSNLTVILKVDVEGFELEVFKGAEKFIDRYKPILLFEILPDHSEKEKEDKQMEIFHFLKSKNYMIYLICQKLGYVEIKQRFHNTSNYSDTDYVAFGNNIIDPHKILDVSNNC